MKAVETVARLAAITVERFRGTAQLIRVNAGRPLELNNENFLPNSCLFTTNGQLLVSYDAVKPHWNRQ
jgi:hypothetical protein